jgi:hypothetical protein
VPVLDVVNGYYDACNNGGDLSTVPLADDVKFSGPLAEQRGGHRPGASLALAFA